MDEIQSGTLSRFRETECLKATAIEEIRCSDQECGDVAEMRERYYTIDTCANEQGDIYYQRAQQTVGDVSETIAYWNAGRKVPAGTEPRHQEFRNLNEAMRARISGGRALLHPIVSSILRKRQANSGYTCRPNRYPHQFATRSRATHPRKTGGL